ncbi:MAG: AEC family transporter, partial [Clostridia bacterium]|nr:AEC family transporter [Clostridia bacterium]
MADFLSYTGTVGIQVIILFLMIGVGFIISKKGFLTSDGAAQMTNLLLYIVTPCVIISSFESMEFNKQSAGELLIAAGCAVVTHVIGFLLGFIIFRKAEKKDKVLLICGGT